MLFLVRFHDRPGTLARRQRLMPDHLRWLAERRATVLVAGSLRTAADAAPVGAAWVVEAADRAAVEALYVSDPFFIGGLRERVEILMWSKAFDDPGLV